MQKKSEQLFASWDKKYEAMLARQNADAGKSLAEEIVNSAQIKLAELDKILQQTLTIDDRVDWSKLKVFDSYTVQPFPEEAPKQRPLPVGPIKVVPKLKLPEFSPPHFEEPEVSFFGKLLGRGKTITETALKRWEEDVERQTLEYEKVVAIIKGEYELEKKHADQAYEASKQKHHNEVSSIIKINEANLANWSKAKERWDEKERQKAAKTVEERDLHNARIRHFEKAWKHGDPEAVVEHASLVLEASNYPD